MNRRRVVSILTLVVLALFTGAAFAQRAAAPAARPGAAARSAAPAAPPTVATVGGRAITRDELDQRLQQVLAEYAQSKGSTVPADMRDLVRRQVLEGLIRAQLMTLEAKRQGMVGSEAEGEEALKQLPVFSPDGHFDANRFQTIKTTRPEQFNAAVASIREQLGARKLALATEQKVAPPEAELRTSATLALTHATVEMLALRTADFAGTFEEPRESQILDWYRTHTADNQREARATLTVVFVNTPALEDSLKRVPAAVEDWGKRMHAAAETIIARVQKGESLDSVAAELGPRSNIVVAADNFPGYWRGTAAQAARVFEPSGRGKVLPEPVAGTDGWLVVRVDDTTPAHLAPLREVAREIRSTMRRENRLHRDEYERQALYAQIRDSLAAPGQPIRYAAVDTARVEVRDPSAEELDAYFRGHQADYASFDPQTGSIVSKSLDDVRDEVRARYLHDRRLLEAKSLADQLLHTWATGGRDAGLETRLGARITPAVVTGSRIDTGLVARVLSDTLWSLPDLNRGGIVPYPRGYIVWQGMARVDRVTPTLEQAQDLLTERLAERHAAADLAGARALFDSDPRQFRRADVVHFTRVTFPLRAQLSVPLTREEVEKWHHDHLERYSAPEMVSAKHILIEPANKTEAADRQALAKAKEILRRAQAGEDFTTLARMYSDDPATRDIGGDLGSFARGVMLEPFEKVAFSLPAGTLYGEPVKTELGYHILKVTEHLDPVVKPLTLIYSAVSGDAADDKAGRMSQEEADSLLRAVKNPREFAAAGARAGARVDPLQFGIDQPMDNPEAQGFFTALRATPAGHIVPGSYRIKGQGTWLAVVDSITPAGTPTWEQARPEAIRRYEQQAGTRAFEAKRAELDSMLASGVSLDSLGAYWGGLQRVPDLSAGRGLPYTGASDQLDSLLFGSPHSAPALAVGAESGWVRGPGGFARLRLVSRTNPTTAQLSQRVEQMRRTAVEQKLAAYFDALKARYPVVILDKKLRDLSLFAMPQPAQAPATP